MAFGLMLGSVIALTAASLYEAVPVGPVLTWACVSLGGLLAAVLGIRLGLTRHLADPSLTLMQMFWATSCVAAGYVAVQSARDLLPCVLAIAMLFGSLGLQVRQILGVTLYAFFAIGSAMIAASHIAAPQAAMHSVTHIVMAGLVLLASMGVSLRVRSLHSHLEKQTQALAEALQVHRALASRDTLTGLLNRRSMLELIELEQRRCLRGQRSMALAVLDLDHFKDINDTHGHAIGDRALQCFAHTVRHTVRGGDVLARWGGEEFVLLLCDVDTGAAHNLLERIGKAVAEMEITEAPPSLRVTVSIGLTPHVAGESIDVTLERADRALYEAKRAGRNRVVVIDAPP
ncbi:diguanylate cyclase [Delftia sp. HK171]|uniref:GGDEF domain-containing protein n=1 Tax=Delftia sp. HK171 TaxID=1920191 RepID=UPI001C8AA990|nr:GGDEF domain-containing protein [Delftia sp. HK171]